MQNPTPLPETAASSRSTPPPHLPMYTPPRPTSQSQSAASSPTQTKRSHPIWRVALLASSPPYKPLQTQLPAT
ncbi:MAG: hypothetical protein RM338_13970 [Nostoc sp. DedQUE12a]|nr:hypothetical protein [Nostoc sp. DedQUE12a]